MSDNLESEETDANWRHIIAISSLVFALIVVAGAIFIHLKPQEANPECIHYHGIPATRAEFNQFSERDVKRNTKFPLIERATSKEKHNPSEIDTLYIFHIIRHSAAASDPDVSASTSKEDETEHNDNISNNNNNKDSGDNKYDDYGKDFGEEFEGNTTTRFTNVEAESEESDSDSDSAEAIEAGTDFRNSLQKLEQLQQELVRCYAATNKSEGKQSTTIAHTPELPLLNELCLQCICETATECRSVECGTGVACGIYRISYNYWIDAGRPRLQGVDDSKNMTERDVYSQCVSNTLCAARAVVTNVNKYARDCNQDGKIDCLDYAELHILGPHGCLRDEMPPIFAMRLDRCLAKFS